MLRRTFAFDSILFKNLMTFYRGTRYLVKKDESFYMVVKIQAIGEGVAKLRTKDFMIFISEFNSNINLHNRYSLLDSIREDILYVGVNESQKLQYPRPRAFGDLKVNHIMFNEDCFFYRIFDLVFVNGTQTPLDAGMFYVTSNLITSLGTYVWVKDALYYLPYFLCKLKKIFPLFLFRKLILHETTLVVVYMYFPRD